MRICREIFGDIPMTAGFDTAFNANIPPVAYLYAVPYEYYEKLRFRRYGYHGLSYQFVIERYKRLASRDNLKGARIVACHLGGGSSVCAIKDGKAIENSFGMGTGQGPACGTRAGTVDHAGLGYLMKAEGLSYDEIESVLHRDSGLLGLSGISGDEYELEKAAAQGNARAGLTLDYMAYQIRGYIGSYAFNLGGAAAIIFTGGLGENSDVMREKILEGLGVFGIELDKNANVAFNRKAAKISAESSRTGIWVIPTNEEIVLARESVALLN
jgi:acetate kinase